MQVITLIKVFCVGVVLCGLFGCCLQSIKLKPQIDAIDLQAAKAGAFSAEIEFKFKECCPNDKQKEIALSIQSKMVDLYEKLLNDEITLKQYNQKVQAAEDAIAKVVLSCASTSREVTKDVMSLDEAWENLKKVDQEL